MVRVGGFEPPTSRVSDVHSNQLSYTRMVDLTGLEPVSKNQLLIRNLILTLQVLPYIYMGQGDDSIPYSLCSPTFREGSYIHINSQ